MKLKAHEISFIVNVYNDSFSTQLYDSVNHSHNGVMQIDKNTKLVVFYCGNTTRHKVYSKARELGILENVIWVQYQTFEHKMVVHSMLQDKVKQPETKMLLDSDDDPDDYIVKPPTGYNGFGIFPADNTTNFNKFYQQRINKVREFRIIWCSWFEDDNESMILEKTMEDASKLIQNGQNGSKFEFLVYDDVRSDTISDDLINRLRIIGKDVAQILQQDYVAVDVAMDSDEQLYFLENNWTTNQQKASHPSRASLVGQKKQHIRLFNNLFRQDYDWMCDKLHRDIKFRTIKDTVGKFHEI